MLCLLGPGDLALVAAIVSVAACAQMVSGFGFALMAVPLMGLAIDLKTAVVISTICGTASNTYQAINDGHDRDRRLVRVLTTTSFLGMPLGFVLLDRIDVDFLRVVIGIVVLLALVAVLRSSSGTVLGGRFLEVLAGFVSGVLATSTSTNGPPLVLLLRSRGLSPEVFRATINTVFSIVAFVSIIIFAFGARLTGEALVGTVVAIPGLGIGMYAGWRLRGAMDPGVFWRIVVGLLTATAISSIVSGLV
ncbi:MAG: sulfite exporter TauE/SafE family protein [Actinobacteria bacterium]|nr:sulfite exporter TauE/SafE family protein [Actinomycetota bacterium]